MKLLTPEELKAYQKSLLYFQDSQDFNNIISTAEWMGEKRQFKIMASNLLKMGFDLESIVKVAEVSVEEVKEVLEEGKNS